MDEEQVVDEEIGDVPSEAIDPGLLDEETRLLAAGLAAQDEGEVLSALEGMQRAVTRAEGENVLVSYVLSSPQCAEIMGAWQAGPGAATAVPVLLLLYYMFQHPLGKDEGPGHQNGHPGNLNVEWHRKRMAVKLRLDKLARSIVRSRMKDIYSHLSSSQKSRKNVALLLLSAIVLRGRALAIEIATSFDFTLEALRKLGHPPKDAAPMLRVDLHKGILKQPTRVAFVEFALAFLSVGDPGLLRWILQKRPLWIGVLHGISKDNESTIVRVLTLIQRKVMAPAFMVPRGLQSVLFGDATLDQLARISSDKWMGDAGELAHLTLLSLCTDPSHGLCPENSDVWEAGSNSKSGGGQGRLLRLMIRLKVTEVDWHRDLLLATARTRPKLATAYLASIPLSLEPRVSPAWFNAMSLVSQLISIASQPSSFLTVAAQSHVSPRPDGQLVRNILASLLPIALARVVLNRGLLHVDFMVKHACLKVLSETLCSLKQLMDAIDAAVSVKPAKESSSMNTYSKSGESIIRKSEELYKQDWMKLSQSIQDMMRASLPDPNTLLAVLSTLKVSKNSGAKSIPNWSEPAGSKKRKRKEPQNEIGTQELQASASDKYDYDATLLQLWGPEILDEAGQREETEGLLHAKVLQVLSAYQTALPIAMADTGFDAFKLLPDDPTSISALQQKSLSALLLAATGYTPSLCSEESRWLIGGFSGFGSAHKKFKPLLLLMLGSEVKEVRDTVYLIVYRIMVSTGAFDSNPREISLWLDFLVQWKVEKLDISKRVEENTNLVSSHTLHSGTLYTSVVDFLSEAVSTIGQTIYKNLDQLHSVLARYTLREATEHPNLQGVIAPEFGPFVVCTIEACIHMMGSESKGVTEISTVALYVANVLSLLLKYQVRPQSLALIIATLLSTENDSLSRQQVQCSEWTPLLVLFQQAQLYLLKTESDYPRNFGTSMARGFQGGKLVEVLKNFQENQGPEEKLTVLISSLVCVSVQELVDNFPLLLRVCLQDLGGDFSVLVALLGIHQELLYQVSTAWSEVFTVAVELAASIKDTSEDTWTVGKLQAASAKLVSPSLVAETSGLCILFLVAPFSVLFTSATNSNQGLLLSSQPFLELLQGGLQRVHYQNWLCMVRLIVSGMTHVASYSLEDVDIGSPLQTCFSLIHRLLLPTYESLDANVLSNGVIGSSNIMPVYEHMIIDLLNHPEVYKFFLCSDWKLGPSTVPCLFVSDLGRNKKNEETCDYTLKQVLSSAATNTHPMDCHILSLLTQLLEFSQDLVNRATSSSETDPLWSFKKKVHFACKPFIMKATSTFQKEVARRSKHGVVASPALFSVSVLISYTDPYLLLNVFLSLLSMTAPKVKISKQEVAAHVLGLYFVTVFLESFSNATPNCSSQMDQYQGSAWEGKLRNNLELRSIYDIYEKVIEQVIKNPSIMADLCLLSFLQSPYPKLSYWPGFEKHSNGLNKGGAALVYSTPLEVLRHCVSRPDKVTGNIAKILVEAGPAHLSGFGWLLTSGTADRRPGKLTRTNLRFAETLLSHNAGIMKMELALSDKDLLSLLPAAQVYLLSESKKPEMKENKVANHVASVYVKFLAKQLKQWDKFVAAEIPIDGAQDMSLLSSTSEDDLYPLLLKYYNCSPLGQVVQMLQFCHILHPLSLKVQSRLFQSLLPTDHVPLITQSKLLSAGENINNCIFEAVAKADIIKHFLFSGFKLQLEVDSLTPATEVSDVSMGEKDSVSLQKFLGSLMSTLSVLYRSKTIDGKKEDTTFSETPSELRKAQFEYFLDETLLGQVTAVAKALAVSSLDISKYVPLFRDSITTLLGYRYGEVSAMKASRYLTFVLFQGLQHQMLNEKESADADVLELLITHSKFLPSMVVVDSKKMHIPHISGKHVGKGTALNSLSSVLSLVGSPLVYVSKTVTAYRDGAVKMSVNLKDTVTSSMKERNKPSVQRDIKSQDHDSLDDLKRLELVKLLRIVLALRIKQSTHGTYPVQLVSLNGILSVLLAAYGGTMSDVDQEIFLVMQDIESHGGLGFSGLSGLDYLWGEAALKRRKANDQVGSNAPEESENMDELRRQTFKEDLLIDPRRCGLTVLFFPVKRQFGCASIGQLELATQYQESFKGIQKRSSGANAGDLRAAAYDPAFLLQFAMHGLSIGCVNAEEFVRLGLLAVAFGSMSSVEENMRKAGYEILAKYYSVLEDGPSFKGIQQIRLLMTYVKNAVTEPWQRLPAVFAVFAAEASCILMNPANHQYMIINRFLLRAPSLDLESVPLFQVMFGSGSVQYRSDRLWMLRLLAAGLRSSLDARVYRRKFVLELLMSFHSSSMADTFPRKWVLQVLYQAATVRTCAQYLVEHTGVFSWLASVAVTDVEDDLGLQDDGGSGQTAAMALRVIERIMSWGSLLESMEELSKVAHIFHSFLTRNTTPQYQHMFRRLTFRIMLTLVHLSHKRRKHQTHFTLNLRGLLEAIDWIGSESRLTGSLLDDTALALQVVLHTSPPLVYSGKDKLCLLKVGSWALSVVLQLEMDSSSSIDSYSDLKAQSQVQEESLSEKLLRWLAAAIIRGEISQGEFCGKLDTCFSLIDGFKPTGSIEGEDSSSTEINEKLASLLLTLQGHGGVNAKSASLVPVVAALVLVTSFARKSTVTGDLAVEVAYQKIHYVLETLLSELPCPEETNLFWLWSFKSPWSTHNNADSSRDDSTESPLYISEICLTLLIFLHQLLSRKPNNYSSLLVHWEGVLSQKAQLHPRLCLLETKVHDALQRTPPLSSEEYRGKNKLL